MEDSVIEKIAALNSILQQKHAKVFSSLKKGKKIDSPILVPLRDWYEWQDGQNPETENLFFDYYRFIPSEESLKLFVSATEYSLPLLTDDAGEGYWFSTLTRKVFYNFEMFYKKENFLFSTFDSFIELLIELAESPAQSVGEFIDIEEALLKKYKA